MEVRAQIEINANDEITTRYFGPWIGQPSRQLKIEQNWKFICNCLRCKDPSDLGTYFSAVKCQTCSNQNLENETFQNGSFNGTSTLSGYILPIDVQVLGTTWKCNSCSKKHSVTDIECILNEVEGSLKNIESEICNALFKKQLSNVTLCIQESSNMLQEKLHPNHYIMFQFKKWVSELSLPMKASIPGSNQHETANEADRAMSCEHKIGFLELQMKYHADVLKIVERLNPGLTINRAGHYKRIAQCRIQLSKNKMLGDPDNYTKLQHMTQMKIAMSELKQVSASFKYPEKN